MDDSDDDSDLDRDVRAILAEFGLRGDEASEAEQPTAAKRAKQVPETRTPLKSRSSAAAQAGSSSRSKRTPAKPKAAEEAPAVKTPPKKASASKTSAKQAASATSVKSKAKAKDSHATSTESKKKVLSEDSIRVRDAKRYFAKVAKQQGKTHVGPSAMPIEDEATGFLAFGDDDDDGSDAAVSVEDGDQDEAAGIENPDSENSSEGEDAAEDRASAPSTPKRRAIAFDRSHRSPTQNGKRPEKNARKIVLDFDEDEEEEQVDQEQHASLDEIAATTPALTREALLDAVPYSKFSPVLEGEGKNIHVVENKRKRGKEALYFGLRHGETLVFLGIGHVEVLHGCVQMGGAVLSSNATGIKAADVFAPISNPLPILKSISAAQYTGQSAALGVSQSTASVDSDSGVDSIFDSVFDSIVKVTPLSSPITALGGACPIGGLATPFSASPSLVLNNDVHQLATIKVLLAPPVDELVQRQKSLAGNGAFSTAGLTATYIPHKWQLALHSLSASALSAAQHPQEESVVALIRGNKKVGKSTFSRMALERLLSMGTVVGGKVAYLELDVGQSDFGPPGIVALHVFSLDDNVQGEAAEEKESDGADHATENGPESNGLEAVPRMVGSNVPHSCINVGPGWCQPRVPLRAHFIGDVSPRDDPESYVAAVHDLVEYFREHVQPGQSHASNDPHRVPLIVNTQGWVKGLGADLAARLEPVLRPTHIFDVIPRGASDAVPPPTRGQPWLDAEGAILGSGPEIITLESVSQLEYVQGAFGPQRDSNGSFKHRESQNGASRAADDKNGPGDGGSDPPRYITEVGSKLAAAESRLLNIMSYLYATQLAPAGPTNGFGVQGAWDFREPLVHRPPLVIDVEQGLKAGIRVLTFGSSVPDSHKLMALDSSIVAIVVTDSSNARQDLEEDLESGEQGGTTDVWRQAFERAAHLSESGRPLTKRCIGLGIVRSIDPASGQIHLLTPLDPAYLQELQSSTGASIGLVKGALDLPVWASLDYETIQEARESRLDVPPAIHDATSSSNGAASNGDEVTAGQQLLAGMPRNKVPYLEWPHSGNVSSRHKGKHAAANGSASIIQLGSEKRRVRRNLMRKSQFV
ncbi:hypothetical protein PSEUBRA_001811 [Kalmanozyma brasiliensis GHG001]|uniref:Polynucleotide 5'-hydroxyl-kinase GRC3 n=1 Tax=Kalmanozyma brasiliensis (strain GHG001) TaxID=1365824 RepID=V5ETV5_KALBG|nr:uncharacterized protein PSEUBRA_001811 [Kalmanozyma brasiliensis GHG001]EST08730.1 hypothetical protein PSEUBRA_001811 [Kalmanozyma brasiliensis GHG001]